MLFSESVFRGTQKDPPLKKSTNPENLQTIPLEEQFHAAFNKLVNFSMEDPSFRLIVP